MDIATEKVILVALAKLFSEQSVFVIGELKQQTKMRFNIAVSAVDSFIKQVEGNLSDEDKQTLIEITDALHDGMSKLRNELTTNK